jgi:hypothetical protein
MIEIAGVMWIILAVVAAYLAMYVMRRADFDKRTKEPFWLPDARRVGFFIASSILILSAISVFDGWRPAPIDLMLLAINVYLLAGNALSAYFRAPPSSGSKLRWATRFGSKKDQPVSLARRIAEGGSWGNQSHQE